MTPHAIIIPHRGRVPSLLQCLASIERSRITCGLPERDVFRVYVVHAPPNGVSGPGLAIEFHDELPWLENLVYQTDSMSVFNKPKLLNLGIESALRMGAEVLTVLDADAIVGERFLEAVSGVDWRTIHRLAYRVRKLPLEISRQILQGTTLPPFDRFDELPLAFEAWGNPLTKRTPPIGKPAWETWRWRHQPWGNSQFSIHRQWLGDTRYDEGFIGRGFEDLDFNCQFARKFQALPGGFRGAFFHDQYQAMLHLTHPYEQDWRTPELEVANHARFIAKRHRFALAGGAQGT